MYGVAYIDFHLKGEYIHYRSSEDKHTKYKNLTVMVLSQLLFQNNDFCSLLVKGKRKKKTK